MSYLCKPLLLINYSNSIKDLIYNLGNFLFEYNHPRRHGGLKKTTPYEKLEKVTKLLRSITAFVFSIYIFVRKYYII